MCGFFVEGRRVVRVVRVMEGVIERRRSWVVFGGFVNFVKVNWKGERTYE